MVLTCNCLFTHRVLQRLMWLVTVAAVAGAALNVLQLRAGFAVWIATNAINAAYNWWIGERAQAVLFAAYLGLAVWGLVSW